MNTTKDKTPAKEKETRKDLLDHIESESERDVRVAKRSKYTRARGDKVLVGA